MAIPSKQRKALRAKFRDWLKSETNKVQSQIGELDKEMKRCSYGIRVFSLNAADIVDCDLSSQLPGEVSDATRLGMLYRARLECERRLWFLSCVLYGSEPQMDLLYQEFRQADGSNEAAHRDMLKALADGLGQELGVEFPRSRMP